MDKENASRITSRRSTKSETFHLAGWRLSHTTKLPGDLPAPLEFHALTLNTIEMQLLEAVADTSMLQCSAQFRTLFFNAHFVADNASHALASSATVEPTFNDEEEVVVIRNGWTPKKKKTFTHSLHSVQFTQFSLMRSLLERLKKVLNTTYTLSMSIFNQNASE